MNTELINLPDGEYNALWSGYGMEISIGNEKVYCNTTTGVRGINCRVIVVLESGIIKDWYE